MKLENQVCSLDLSKQLKELGIKQKSLFYWIKEEEPYIWYNSNNHPMKVEKFYFSAFLATELLELLPSRISTIENEPFNHFRLRIEKAIIFFNEIPKDCYLINYRCDTTYMGGAEAWMERTLLRHNIYAVSLVDALACIIIELFNLKFIEIQNEKV